jgi:uncharacterized protein
MKPGWVRTYSGKYVNLLDLQASDIQAADIAHHLSLECRWGGACRHHYSVAEHSLWVARWAKKLCPRPEAEAYALLHDAHEAYVKDIPTPVKVLLGDVYEDLCWRVDNAIRAHFGLGVPDAEISAAVKQADQYCAWAEQKALCPSGPAAGQKPPEVMEIEMGMVEALNYSHAPQLMERAFAACLESALRNK